MSNVQSSRMVKAAQLRLRLLTLLIQRIDKEIKLKLKTVTKLAEIIGRRWRPHLDMTTLLHQKSKATEEYRVCKKNGINLRYTYLEERAW